MQHFNYHLCTTLILLSHLLPWVSSLPPPCNKCTSLPPDCLPNQEPPFNGGPPCTCTSSLHPKGCVLKPCSLVPTDSLCDCTLSLGSLEAITHPYRLFCRKYPCTGNPNECETCIPEIPPNCTHSSYFNPPSAGGPECACELEISPGGCTLKTCGNTTAGPPDPCVPRLGVGEPTSFNYYGTTCPGTWDGVVRKPITIKYRSTEWGLVLLGVMSLLGSILLTWVFKGYSDHVRHRNPNDRRTGRRCFARIGIVWSWFITLHFFLDGFFGFKPLTFVKVLNSIISPFEKMSDGTPHSDSETQHTAYNSHHN